jgi:hypothetical protein
MSAEHKLVQYMNRGDRHEHKAKLSLCLTNETLHHEDTRESGYTDLSFLNLGTSWR